MKKKKKGRIGEVRFPARLCACREYKWVLIIFIPYTVNITFIDGFRSLIFYVEAWNFGAEMFKLVNFSSHVVNS